MASALSSSAVLRRESTPTSAVSFRLKSSVRKSHRSADERGTPSSGPTMTSVEIPKIRLYTGAQITVETDLPPPTSSSLDRRGRSLQRG